MFVTLMYHIVDRRIWSQIAVSEEAFEAQLAHLRSEGYPVLTLPEVVRIVSGATPPPQRGVFLTFDDGYADNLSAALPRLRHYGAEATMFVPTEYVGRRDAWNAGSDDGLRYLDWHELESWLAGGGDGSADIPTDMRRRPTSGATNSVRRSSTTAACSKRGSESIRWPSRIRTAWSAEPRRRRWPVTTRSPGP